MPEAAPLRLHEDLDHFREAVTFTAAETGFSPQLIEKDYFCTLVLQDLAANAADLVFKGGTCLAKVHSDFYRLSEDLDFLIPTAVSASRGDRSRRALATKSAFDRIGERVAALRVEARLKGANESKQYIGAVTYESRLARRTEQIKVEIGLREPLLTPAVRGHAKTLLMDPIVGGALVAAFPLQCLSWEESMAEKLRAAVSRREPAIRDYYDIHHAVFRRALRLLDRDLVKLVRKKVAVPGNRPVPMSTGRLTDLRAQIATRLRPVLRDRDMTEFSRYALDRVFSEVLDVAAALD